MGAGGRFAASPSITLDGRSPLGAVLSMDDDTQRKLSLLIREHIETRSDPGGSSGHIRSPRSLLPT